MTLEWIQLVQHIYSLPILQLLCPFIKVLRKVFYLAFRVVKSLADGNLM